MNIKLLKQLVVISLILNQNSITACSVFSDDIESVRKAIYEGQNINEKDKKYGCTPLMHAVMQNNIDLAKFLIMNNADVDEVNQTGMTALMYASNCGYDRIEMVKLLIYVKANVNIKDNDGWTALNYAIANIYTDIAEELIKAGANIYSQTNGGLNTLEFAESYNRFNARDAIVALLEKKNQSNLHSKEYSTVKNAIEAGADLSLEAVKQDYSWKVSPLAIKIDKNTEDSNNIAILLIENGADVNERSYEYKQFTPLMLAARKNNVLVAAKLLEFGANVDDIDEDGHTALDIAKSKKSKEVEELLLNKMKKVEIYYTSN